MLVMSDATRRRVEDIVNDAKSLAAQVSGKPTWSGKDVPEKRSFQEHEAQQLVRVARRLGADAICFARLLEATLAKDRRDARAEEKEVPAQ
jgi:hypothetical protein